MTSGEGEPKFACNPARRCALAHVGLCRAGEMPGVGRLARANGWFGPVAGADQGRVVAPAARQTSESVLQAERHQVRVSLARLGGITEVVDTLVLHAQARVVGELHHSAYAIERLGTGLFVTP